MGTTSVPTIRGIAHPAFGRRHQATGTSPRRAKGVRDPNAPSLSPFLFLHMCASQKGNAHRFGGGRSSILCFTFLYARGIIAVQWTFHPLYSILWEASVTSVAGAFLYVISCAADGRRPTGSIWAAYRQPCLTFLPINIMLTGIIFSPVVIIFR